ncbi:Cysteine_synthase A [Hexamita inflata]|uniref:Cysteine_synthase A n=1 Tax=Hexamita inflata TaxID=28002 RepID=A0ABP1IMQ2_9EUKA
MALIYDVIGETPLVRLQRIPKSGRVLLKLESKNPGGSIKDRPGFQMLKDLLDEGKIDSETVLIEPTSGNTGIGLSMAAAALGLKMTIVMPENMSEERKKLMKAYGSELVLTEAALGVAGSVTKAEELQKSLPKAHIIGQFYNQSNPKAHMLTTAPEIVKQVKQQVLHHWPRFSRNSCWNVTNLQKGAPRNENCRFRTRVIQGLRRMPKRSAQNSGNRPRIRPTGV